jgi:LasA protease
MLLVATLLFTAQSLPGQISDDDFVFRPLTQLNDWEGYFSGPLSEHREYFTHWCGSKTVNPNLVLALMEMQSGLVSSQDSKDRDRPFGVLSSETGFRPQLIDILTNLTNTFYDVLEEQELEFEKSGRLEEQATAGTRALTGLLGPELNQFFDSYQTLFNRSLVGDKALVATHMEKNNPPSFQLPWPRGDQWMGGGAHGHDGRSTPYSSLDYARRWPSWGGAVNWVHASHGGTVFVYSSCYLEIVHSSGWTTGYYHLDQIQVSHRSTVSQNQRLALYASNRAQALCQGGSSTGPHVHLTLINNGRYQSLQGHTFSGWSVNIGRWSYDDDCNFFYYWRGSSWICAWRMMTA